MPKHPVDIHVGKQLRKKRTEMGLSQEELAKKVGVTFQQIQKYENGNNRIASSRLYEFAKSLNCEVNWFFEEYDDEVKHSDKSDQPSDDEKEYKKIKRDFCQLPITKQKALGKFIKSLS